MIDLSKLTKDERFIFEWQYHMCGSFYSALADAISRADGNNIDKLAKGFPDEVEGYLKFSREEGWWQKVKDKAGITSTLAEQ